MLMVVSSGEDGSELNASPQARARWRRRRVHVMRG